MSSERPETSVPRSSEPASEDSATTASSSSNTAVREKYTPHVFDLVTPTHRARDTIQVYIPSAFLQSEAVDSSLLLGHGASFTVSRQALPPGPSEIVQRTDMNRWSVETVTKAPERPRYIVYKAARVSFQANGEPTTPEGRRALQSVLTEFHALLHPPLQAHPNVIDFLGLAWGSNHADPRHRLPVLVVEYGDRGTLADVQLRGPILSDSLKREICLGIARGLNMLHQHGIIHGDVKPDNIIMCSHKEKILVPKLADFGFAIIESSEAPEVTIGGTRTWRAPESFSPIPVSRIKLTDVYSFGLVAWSIAIDGRDPFDLMLPSLPQADSRYPEIDRLKLEDKVLGASKLEAWVMKWYLSSQVMTVVSQMPGGPALDPDRLRQLAAATSSQYPAQQPIAQLLGPLSQAVPLFRSPNAASEMSQAVRQRDYYKNIELIFANTLSKHPEDRDLLAVIKLLDDSKGAMTTERLSELQITDTSGAQSAPEVVETKTEECPSSPPKVPGRLVYRITNRSGETKRYKRTAARAQPVAWSITESDTRGIDWSALGFKRRKFSWQQLRDLEPAVQSFVVDTLLHLNDSPSQFALGVFIMNGLGIAADTQRALKLLAEAANKGHAIAQACMYRVFIACGEEIPPEIPILKYLNSQALRGSRLAQLDLKTLRPEEGKQVRELLKYGYGGVGANWFNESQWYHGLTQPKLMSKDFHIDSLGSKSAIGEVVVNIRGDRIIHAAAAIGAYRIVRELLDDVKIDVNQRNADGETALLCACRSGHPDIVKYLLDSGAKASIQSKTGESPLHWLIAFDETVNPAALGKDLIERGGADVAAFTTQRLSHSGFPSSIDVDFQMEGTPLMWAVHDNKPKVVSYLLSAGSNPNWMFMKNALSPLQWAAHYHYKDCLKLMIEHLERDIELPTTTDGGKDIRYAVVYGSLVRFAVHASDKFSMILRNGKSYIDQLRNTMEYLHEKTRLVRFGMGAPSETLLHFAAAEAHDEACKIILDLKWRIDEINQPAGPAGMTPLLESVRWNRRNLFWLLRDHGADATMLAVNPYNEYDRSWSALHIFAEQAHGAPLGLVDDLVAAGVPVDGDPAHNIETPFHVAVRRNAFHLADRLLDYGARLNEPRLRSSMIVSPHPLTGLGHIIALNARSFSHGLQYLLGPHEGVSEESRAEFIVEPARGLSALHLCAIVPEGLVYAGSGTPLARGDFDWETNRAITHELLEWFRQPSRIDLKSQIQGKTALHLAAEYGNVGVAEELVKLGADKTVRCETGESPGEIARRVFDKKSILGKLLAYLD